MKMTMRESVLGNVEEALRTMYEIWKEEKERRPSADCLTETEDTILLLLRVKKYLV